jgi:hypothetical protein
MEHSAGQLVPVFSSIQLRECSPSLCLIVHKGEEVNGFVDPPQ